MRKIVLALGITLISILTLVRGADPYLVQATREFYFDYLQRLSPREYTQLPVRVVDIDENSLAAIGQWPWPRDQLATLVERLDDYGAAVVVFDILFSEPDRMSPAKVAKFLSDRNLLATDISLDQLAILDTDAQFATAIAGSNVVLGTAHVFRSDAGSEIAKAGFVEIGANPAAGLPVLTASSPILPELREAAAGIGSISVSPSGQTNLVRKTPLAWQSNNGVMPGLALEALRLALGESTIVIQGFPDLPGVTESLRVGDMTIPTLPDAQLWIRYRRDDPRLYVSAKDVLSERFDPAMQQALDGNIVLIGTSAAGLLDIRTTAIGENVPGVSIHAQILEQILLSDYLVRDDLIVALEILAFVVFGLTVLGVMTLSGPIASISAGVFVGALVLGGSWFAFRNYGILFDATYPVIGGFLAFSGLAAYQFIVADRDKRLIRASFSHYVSSEILDQIEKSGHTLGLGGVNRTITIMFCDIRNFTPLSETMSATDLVTFLNELFTKMGAEILAEHGTIDKFIGDAIMAFWNAPLETEHHRAHAAAAALRMREALTIFNAAQDHPPIATAIGISSGLACVGNIGSQARFNYSAIGDTVNVAARIETNCRHVQYDILLTKKAAEGVQDMALLQAGHLNLKGKVDRATTFILVGDATLKESADFQALTECHARLIEGIEKTGQLSLHDQYFNECSTLAERVQPSLPAFYQRLPERLDDFGAIDEMQNRVA